MKFRTQGAEFSMAMILMFVLIGIVYALIRRSVYGKHEEYDERQERARGIAAQWGFLTMALFNMGMWLFLDLVETELPPILALRLSVYLGILVYGTIAIWKDAYVGLLESYEGVLGSLGLLTAYRWMNFFTRKDGYTLALSDAEGWTDLGGVILFTWLTGLLAIKWMLKKKEESEAE